MSNYIGITKPLNIVSSAYSNVDAKYGPYDSIDNALQNIPRELRKIGLTVGITLNNTVTEYWFNGGIEDSNLNLKLPSTSNPYVLPNSLRNLSLISGYGLVRKIGSENWVIDTQTLANSHTHNNKSTLDSITNQKILEWDTAYSNWSSAYSSIHEHNNFDVLNLITSQTLSNWNYAFTHTGLKNNPHEVTAAQVGLGNVTNESKATMFNNSTFTGDTIVSDLYINNILKLFDTFQVLPSTTGIEIYYNDTHLLSISDTGNLSVKGEISAYAL